MKKIINQQEENCVEEIGKLVEYVSETSMV